MTDENVTTHGDAPDLATAIEEWVLNGPDGGYLEPEDATDANVQVLTRGLSEDKLNAMRARLSAGIRDRLSLLRDALVAASPELTFQHEGRVIRVPAGWVADPTFSGEASSSGGTVPPSAAEPDSPLLRYESPAAPSWTGPAPATAPAGAEQRPGVADGLGESDPRADVPAPDAAAPDAASPNAPFADVSFAPYRGAPPEQNTCVSLDRTREGAVVGRWPSPQAPADSAIIYRVVWSEDYRPYNPDFAASIAVTKLTESVVPVPQSGVAHLQVWFHVGESDEDAIATEPRFLGDGVVVASPVVETAREVDGRVIISWSAPTNPMIIGAAVHRLAPVPGTEGLIVTSSQAQDDRAVPGVVNVYGLTYEARLPDGGVVQSPAVHVEVRTQALLLPVDDLTAEPAQVGEGFDLRWTTPPQGQVRVYRTAKIPPTPHEPLREPVEALVQKYELQEEARLPYGTEHADHWSYMRGVQALPGASAVHFTPVTVLGEEIIVGRPVTATPGPPAPKSVAVVERGRYQMVRFGWPEGATDVHLHVLRAGTADAVAAAVSMSPTATITEDQHRARGGIALDLPWYGCSVVLSSSMTWAGRKVEGGSVHVEYPGLLNLSYSVNLQGLLRASRVELSVWATNAVNDVGTPVTLRPALVLVGRRGRIPLSARDGEVIPLRPQGTAGEGTPTFKPQSLHNPPGQEKWVGSLPEFPGEGPVFVRLFLAQHNPSIGLVDPPLKSLKR